MRFTRSYLLYLKILLREYYIKIRHPIKCKDPIFFCETLYKKKACFFNRYFVVFTDSTFASLDGPENYKISDRIHDYEEAESFLAHQTKIPLVFDENKKL